MTVPILILAGVSFILSWGLTFAMKRLALRIGLVDRPGMRKIHQQPKPLGGGVAIFCGIALPMVAAVLVLNFADRFAVQQLGGTQEARDLVAGAQYQTPMTLGMLGALLALHGVGLMDDRKALGPFTKLIAQVTITTTFVLIYDVRALTALDALTPLGKLPSVAITVLWIVGVTNAFNFLDNMDGLAAGVAAVCATAFLITALTIGQWFVAATLALLLGAVLGFLCFNFPPASIFMGDSGSLVIGLLLGILTVRTTFLPHGTDWGAGWYVVFAPVIVLAVPLYDTTTVMLWRLRHGKSPFVGDTNHFSHRLVARGMSRRTAVLCIYLVTAATSMAAILLPHVNSPSGAMLIFAQTLLVLGVVALLEQHPLPIADHPVVATPASPLSGHGEAATQASQLQEKPSVSIDA
jgi:UDP-GlcNAc:undecaprenyl-phosphate GlcNAc-1-phosphate transferase